MDKKLKFDVPATLAAAPKDEEAPDAQEVEVVEPPEPQMAPRPIVVNPGPYRAPDEELRPLPTINPGPSSAPPAPPPRVNPGPLRWEPVELPPEPIRVNPGPDEAQPREAVQRDPYDDATSEEE